MIIQQIEISTTSRGLAEELKRILELRTFRVGFRKQVREKWGWNTRYIISLNGEGMLKKWMNEIGFSNPRHYRKYQMWKTKYIGDTKEKIAGITQPGRVSVRR